MCNTKISVSRAVHVTCVAHLLHNCAMKVKSHFEDVDQSIAKVKSTTLKSKTRQAKFATIGSHFSLSNAALYYAKKLPEVKAIVESFERSSILATQA